ncbi:MAG: hypothetical protein A3F40_04740 [Chlamydiae bacterium RIFCSPHIGHO2_12_FULL_27_8]|nr:MAG: hypothetical protein A3F40_04740 [Chlamydiae bacterium RIFCSPHIGHO2_12_FULL_27_8]
MNKQKFMINFLNAFFRLFQAHINKIKFEKDHVIGSIIWNDTKELQEFSWIFSSDIYNYENTIQLIDFLIHHKLIEGDKIVISKIALINILKKFNWDLKKIEDSISFLCSIRIPMIDDAEISDYFFIHF